MAAMEYYPGPRHLEPCPVVDEIFAIEATDMERARAILLANERLSARDALHVAIMERHSVPRIMSFDAGFDGLPNIKRLS
jgi:uncharacterized protein